MVFYIPIGIIALPFFQLIEDKTSKDIHGDKLDLYVGVNLGSGVAIAIPSRDYKDAGLKTSIGMLFVGPQVGVKYFFKPKIGVYAEVGYGKSLMEAGISFKL